MALQNALGISPLVVTLGGTGLASTTINSILYSSSNNVIGQITPSADKLLTYSGAGVPGAYNPGSGLIIVNGVVSINYNTTNLKITSTQLNTIQDIATTSAVQFGSLTLTTPLGAANGGTGISNAAGSTITLGGALTTAGAFASTFTMTGTTNVTFPTSGTLATTAGTAASITGTANQVLANGTSGSAQTGAVTLTTPQNIGTSSGVNFGSLTVNTSSAVPISSYSSVASSTPFASSNQFNLSSYNQDATNNNWQFIVFNDHLGGISTAIGTQITNQSNGTADLNFYTKPSGGAVTNQMKIASTGAVTLTIPLGAANGGTGIANAAGSTITLGGALTTAGAFASTFTMTNTTSVTFPTSGTLATTAQIPSTPISLANGGTNASLVASNGGIFYSTASAGAILSGTATANQVLLSGSSTTPAWSTATYPATTTINQLLYSSSANVISGLATGNNGVLVTGAGGIPAISSTIPNATQDNITRLGTIASIGAALGTAFGGTGTTTTFTQGSAIYAGASGIYSQDNANYFWDATNHFLGLGTTSPNGKVDIRFSETGTTPFSGNATHLRLQNTSNTTNNYANIGYFSQGGTVTSAISTQFTDQTNGYGDLVFITRSAATGITEKMRVAGSGIIQLQSPSFTANATTATLVTSLGPPGANTTIQEWLTIKNAGGTTRYIPCF